MSKAIFLDVDGVLNCETSKSRCGYFLGVDKDKVVRLAKIVEITGADIILSSSWKYGWFIDYTKNERHARYLNNHLFKKGKLRIKDKTPDYPRIYRRGHEIEEYLKTHPDYSNWVVLDDEMFYDYYDNPLIMDHLVKTNSDYGLTDQDVEKAIDILNNML